MASQETPTAAPGGEDAGPRVVSRFEAQLLRILRFFLRQAPAEQALRLVNEKHPRPKCLSANAVHLVKDTLSKGCVLYLTRAGAWRRDRFLRKGAPVAGRLWERGPVDERQLAFSKQAMEFLIWVTANKPTETKPLWKAPVAELTPADQLLLFLAYQELRVDPDVQAVLRQPGTVFTALPLCWLMYPDDFAGLGPEAVPSFAPWMSGVPACILEAMQPTLALRWLHIERGKGQVGDWLRMRVQGQAQRRVLERFTESAERAERPDLARFLLRVAAQVLATPNLPLTFWTGGLQGSGPARLADRLETQRAALALLRHLETLRGWERRARTVGYFDEGYAASQLWLSDWEAHDGDAVFARAEAILQQLQPLRVGGGAPSSPRDGEAPAEPQGT